MPFRVRTPANRRCIPFIHLMLMTALITVSISGCNYFQEKSLPNVTVLNPEATRKIKKIAVLQFVNLTDNPSVDAIARKRLAVNLVAKGYTVMPLDEVDYFLDRAAIDKTKLNAADIYKLGKILRADTLIHGTITRCSKVFAGLYSNVTIGAWIKMVDTETSDTIWEAEHVEIMHGGGFPSLSPFSIPGKIVDSYLNVREKVINDTVDTLAQKFIGGIPDKPFLRPYETDVVSIVGGDVHREVRYIIRAGETLYGIADKFYGNGKRWREIKAANEDINESQLVKGQVIVVPDVPILDDLGDAHLFRAGGANHVVYKVKWGDSLYKIADAVYGNGNAWKVIYESNKGIINSTRDLSVGQILILPLEGGP